VCTTERPETSTAGMATHPNAGDALEESRVASNGQDAWEGKWSSATECA
jgi:hypothetical protein